jgi:hypothetical protein
VAVCGTFQDRTHEHLKIMIKFLGGRYRTTVNEGTDFLIQGQLAPNKKSIKVELAKRHKVRIVGPNCLVNQFDKQRRNEVHGRPQPSPPAESSSMILSQDADDDHSGGKRLSHRCMFM